MISAATREAYEAQATACLEVAAARREHLLAVAYKLAGSAEGGMDLFQQTCLNCHDAIQRGGFKGDRYEFYLLRALKNLHYREAKQPQPLPLPAELEVSAELTPAADSYAFLAEQVEAEIRERFKPADRVVLRLHLQGIGCQEIADLIGRRDRTCVWRRLERMKEVLRESFQQAWDTLNK